jgi:hypothetical protein
MKLRIAKKVMKSLRLIPMHTLVEAKGRVQREDRKRMRREEEEKERRWQASPFSKPWAPHHGD